MAILNQTYFQKISHLALSGHYESVDLVLDLLALSVLEGHIPTGQPCFSLPVLEQYKLNLHAKFSVAEIPTIFRIIK